MTKVIGIDPGLKGAIVITDGDRYWGYFAMPVSADKTISFSGLKEILQRTQDLVGWPTHVFLEKPVSFGMGTKAAFNYGRGFEAILNALEAAEAPGLPYTLLEPAKWAKEMHQGVSSDLKPKVKSAIAASRLFPNLVGKFPRDKKGVPLDGPIDALLIAGYGLRQLTRLAVANDSMDFY